MCILHKSSLGRLHPNNSLDLDIIQCVFYSSDSPRVQVQTASLGRAGEQVARRPTR